MTTKQEPSIPSEDWSRLTPEARALISYLRKKPDQRGPEPDRAKAEASINAASEAVKAEYKRLSGRASRGGGGSTDRKTATKTEDSFTALFGTTGGTAQSFILRLDQTRAGYAQKPSMHEFGVRKIAKTIPYASGEPFVGFNRAGGLKQRGIPLAEVSKFGSHDISGFIYVPDDDDTGDLYAVLAKAKVDERQKLAALLKGEHWLKVKPNDAGAYAVSDSVSGPRWAEDAKEHALELQTLDASEKLSGWTAEKLGKLAESAYKAEFVPVTQIQVAVGNNGVTFASQSDLMAALNALRTYVPKANAAAANPNLPQLKCLPVDAGYQLYVDTVDVGIIPSTNILATITRDFSAVTAAISKLRHGLMSLSRDDGAGHSSVMNLSHVLERLLEEAREA